MAGEREQGTLAYLLAQPVSRAEVLLGKLFGLGASLMAALLLGFGLAAAIIAWQGGGVEAGRYGFLVLFSLLLALASLSLGLALSAWSRSAALAAGLALFAWLVLVFLGDLGLMGTAVVMRIDIDALFTLALLNPLQVFKIAAVYGLRQPRSAGAGGALRYPCLRRCAGPHAGGRLGAVDGGLLRRGVCAVSDGGDF
ncbi:MAG: ABC transporter permease [Caldilineaceae bacterium]